MVLANIRLPSQRGHGHDISQRTRCHLVFVKVVMMWYPSPKMPEDWARVEWCIRAFGCLGAYGPPAIDKWEDLRWYRFDGRLYFKNESDLALYLLRWA